jgi:hypothetical protein
MKRTIKRLREINAGDSSIRIGLTVVFGRNEEEWKGRIADRGIYATERPFYAIENAVSGSGKVQTFTISDNEVTGYITDLEIEHGFYG